MRSEGGLPGREAAVVLETSLRKSMTSSYTIGWMIVADSQADRHTHRQTDKQTEQQTARAHAGAAAGPSPNSARCAAAAPAPLAPEAMQLRKKGAPFSSFSEAVLSCSTFPFHSQVLLPKQAVSQLPRIRLMLPCQVVQLQPTQPEGTDSFDATSTASNAGQPAIQGMHQIKWADQSTVERANVRKRLSEAKSVAFCMDLLTALAAGKVCKAFWRVDGPEPDPLTSSPLPNQLRIPAFEPVQEECAR
ncbi:MAG: hypothetical protein FRX49_10785 [Trebouxia sp. A1-2]|nr:MAG: hypothetical protein FRX49_10785 [Trebouxia sp. A1-2]